MATACVENGNYVDVSASYSALYLCSNHQIIKRYTVALGRGGTDKHVVGDARTPIGQYRLGAPHASERFFIFIPIGYPTREQAKAGYTGENVGVHGPINYLDWLYGANTWVNWTNGCIAVGSEDEINEIAGWVHSHQISKIVIRP